MHINVDIEASCPDNQDIDLQELYDLDYVFSEGDMFEALKIAVAGVALEYGVGFDKVTPDYFEGEDSTSELKIYDNGTDLWLHEVATLAFFLLSDPSNEEGAYLSYIDNEGWACTDFDALKDIDDKYYGRYDDAEEFGREYMDNSGDGIPERLESYFDFEGYGEAMSEGMNVCQWDYNYYYFSE